MTTHDESPIIRTSKKRLAQGLAIIVITMAVGAAIAVPYWNEMAQTPPPVSTIVIESPTAPEGEGDEIQEGTEEVEEGETGGATGTGAEGGTTTPATGTTITILTGSSVQGNPDYEPDDAEVPLNDNIVWVNEDTVPHTSTSGTGAEDANSGKIFDTSIINGGEESSPVQLTGVKEGDEVPYYCQVHPYMTSKLTVGAASAGGATAATGSTAGNASSAGGGGSNATTTTSTTGTSAGNASSTSEDTTASAGSTAGNASSAGGGGNATTTTTSPPATTAATAAAAATLTIPQGASVQGNEYYDPADLSIKVGDTIAVENKDTTPHTVTNGKDATDPNMGKLFDTSIINAGDSADIVTADLKPGDYAYFCAVHPYMTGSLTVQ
ncbi:MAG: cupredoxin domain-containing protein [Nitrososphaeraceae archaeon]